MGFRDFRISKSELEFRKVNPTVETGANRRNRGDDAGPGGERRCRAGLGHRPAGHFAGFSVAPALR